MDKRVDLDKIIEQMEFQTDETSSYLNKKTGELVLISDSEFRAVENEEPLDEYPQWQHENLKEAKRILETDQYIRLPTQFDIHEWAIMKDFCYSVQDEEIRNSLLNAIHGRGAFRMFKDHIRRFGVLDDWYKFRAEAFRRKAIRWCERNGIEYTEKSDE